MTFEWPLQTNPFEMTTVPAEDDYILHVDDDNCQKFGEIQDAVESAKATVNALDDMEYDMKKSGFFEQIMKKTNTSDVKTDDMYDMLNYIYWTN